MDKFVDESEKELELVEGPTDGPIAEHNYL
jgi:hypothetical protein